MATAADLCRAALREIGVLSADEAGAAGDITYAFERLNRFLDRLAAEKQSIYAVTRTATAALTASQASFTVGSGGNISIARPVFLDHVGYIDQATDPDTEFPLKLLTEAEYQAWPLKALTSTRPTAAYYSPTYPTGTLYPLPIPTDANLLWAVYHWTAVTQFAAQGTTVALPPAYEEMLVTNLALLLCPSFERPPNPILVRAADKAMSVVKGANSRLRELTFPQESLIQGGGAAWSIRTGP